MNAVEVQGCTPPLFSLMLQLNGKERMSLPGEKANGNPGREFLLLVQCFSVEEKHM